MYESKAAQGAEMRHLVLPAALLATAVAAAAPSLRCFVSPSMATMSRGAIFARGWPRQVSVWFDQSLHLVSSYKSNLSH
jgi:hypothetical protein